MTASTLLHRSRIARALLLAPMAAVMLVAGLPASPSQGAARTCDDRALIDRQTVNGPRDLVVATVNDTHVVASWTNDYIAPPCKGLTLSFWGLEAPGVPGVMGKDWWRAGSDYRIKAEQFPANAKNAVSTYTSPPLDCWFPTHREARALLVANRYSEIRDGKYGRASYPLPNEAIGKAVVRIHRLFDTGEDSYSDLTFEANLKWDGRPETLAESVASETPWDDGTTPE